MQAAEAAVAQIHSEEQSHCRQIVAEAKAGTVIKTGARLCPMAVCPLGHMSGYKRAVSGYMKAVLLYAQAPANAVQGPSCMQSGFCLGTASARLRRQLPKKTWMKQTGQLCPSQQRT